MIQQLKNTKTDKQFTQNDLARVAYASCLNFFHTNSMFNPWSLGIYYALDYTYVKRLSADSYQYQAGYATMSKGTSPSTMNKSCGQLLTKTQNEVQAFHQDLICDNDGEERLLIVCYYRKTGSFTKSKLGFFLLNPKIEFYNFVYKLVITPKPGLFPGKHEIRKWHLEDADYQYTKNA